jgi:hypothetical protein
MNSLSVVFYRVFRAQADWTFILPSELLTTELRHLPRKMPPQAYQTSQYVVPHSGIFIAKCHSCFAGSSDGKMNVQSACALNTQYVLVSSIRCHGNVCLASSGLPRLLIVMGTCVNSVATKASYQIRA